MKVYPSQHSREDWYPVWSHKPNHVGSIPASATNGSVV